MSDITAVSFVPKSRRQELRQALTDEDTGELKWRERRTLYGSEFYFSGPAGLVMKTHTFVSWWLASPPR